MAAYGNSARGAVSWVTSGDGFGRFDLFCFWKVTKPYQKCTCEHCLLVHIQGTSFQTTGKTSAKTLATEAKSKYSYIDVGRCPAWSHCQEVWKRERDDGVKNSGFFGPESH